MSIFHRDDDWTFAVVHNQQPTPSQTSLEMFIREHEAMAGIIQKLKIELQRVANENLILKLEIEKLKKAVGK